LLGIGEVQHFGTWLLALDVMAGVLGGVVAVIQTVSFDPVGLWTPIPPLGGSREPYESVAL
jgi:hypothetical protein